MNKTPTNPRFRLTVGDTGVTRKTPINSTGMCYDAYRIQFKPP